MSLRIILIILSSLFIFSYCNQSDSSNAVNTVGKETLKTSSLFKRIPSIKSGITFNNQIIEDDTYNHILVDVVFNGGGVAVIDINNDGLQDLFFSGNMVEDKLYLNKGNMKFEDITKKAGIKSGSWSTALSVADVNNDGYLDIYVGKFMLDDPELRRNHLYINNKNETFSEQAAQYGLDDNGHCTAVNFFDYDKDGDMDLYVGNEPFVKRHTKYNKNFKYDKLDHTDRLFRNNGSGKFTDVTHAAGITNFNYTLSATVSDLNNDGWPDIYVACDYEEPDHYYQNLRNGKFAKVIDNSMRHISNFSMGVDMADFNNDGWIDLYVADMAPADNYRSKANMSGMNPEKFWGLANAGYHYQYMFNTLQLNNGNGTFSEIGQMAGVAQTDWSWTTLFADFDNDGDKDLYVTNGQPKDTRNKDYIHARGLVIDSLAAVARAAGQKPAINSLDLVGMAPEEKLSNYLFMNNGDLTFSDEAKKEGASDPSWTQGAAYVDLDNDGDLDLVTNNIDDPAFLYENRATQLNENSFLKVKLIGDHGQNILSFGAKAWIYYGDEMQLLEVSPNRGYMSVSDPVLHFGLGKTSKIDRLFVEWQDGRQMELTNVETNQVLTLKQADAQKKGIIAQEMKMPLFEDITKNTQIDYGCIENEFDDYASEILLPHRMSRLGPCSATADVDGDGLEDIYFGAAAGQEAALFLQKENNTFVRSIAQPWKKDKQSEDINALFFDADGDGDADLYVVSGGNEFKKDSPAFQDRLYFNQGKGIFKKGGLPNTKASGGVAKAGDIDGDGDLDLFVGGRQVPLQYGYPARSYILINDKGRFTDQTNSLAPELMEPGMVTDAHWMDIDQDKDQDLVVVGEWMPISIYLNNKGKLNRANGNTGLDNTNGWWNRIAAADMDGDGDEDLMVGNLGLNIKFKASDTQPFSAKIKDFDENGSNDIYLAYYGTDGQVYPVRGRQCSSEQLPYIKEKFKTYDEFAKASYDEVLGDLADGAISHEVQMFESVYLENLGNGKFNISKLPMLAQAAPIFGILPRDWNGDGHMDLLVAGNYYEREVETTRSDAGIGTLLLGNGKGDFDAVSSSEVGLKAYLDVRNLVTVKNKQKEPLVFILNNNAGLQIYTPRNLIN